MELAQEMRLERENASAQQPFSGLLLLSCESLEARNASVGPVDRAPEGSAGRDHRHFGAQWLGKVCTTR